MKRIIRSAVSQDSDIYNEIKEKLHDLDYEYQMPVTRVERFNLLEYRDFINRFNGDIEDFGQYLDSLKKKNRHLAYYLDPSNTRVKRILEECAQIAGSIENLQNYVNQLYQIQQMDLDIFNEVVFDQ